MNGKYNIILVDDDFIFLEMLKEALTDNPDYNMLQPGSICTFFMGYLRKRGADDDCTSPVNLV